MDLPARSGSRALQLTFVPADPVPAASSFQAWMAGDGDLRAALEELGLPAEASMVDAVTAANRIVGFDSIGSLTDQVGRLLRETGIQPVRGAAGGATSAGTATEAGELPADVSDGASSRPSSARPPSSRGAITTQTAPQKSFYERFLEQKRKDGVA